MVRLFGYSATFRYCAKMLNYSISYILLRKLQKILRSDSRVGDFQKVSPVSPCCFALCDMCRCNFQCWQGKLLGASTASFEQAKSANVRCSISKRTLRQNNYFFQFFRFFLFFIFCIYQIPILALKLKMVKNDAFIFEKSSFAAVCIELLNAKMARKAASSPRIFPRKRSLVCGNTM